MNYTKEFVEKLAEHQLSDMNETYNSPECLLNAFYEEISSTSVGDIIKTGIPPLDERIIGIFKTSLVVISGETGQGKSLLAGNIAMNAVKQGKRVAYFDLENDSGDFLRRQIAKECNSKGVKVLHPELRIKEYFKKNEDKISEIAFDIANRLSGRFLLYNNVKIPTIADFEKALEQVENYDLVVIDHLHYFQFEQNENESENIGRIMRQLRILTKKKQIPIILVAHLRKKQGAKAMGNDDLYGSSNIAKEAETVIILSKDETGNRLAVTKNRNTGIVDAWNYDKINYDFKNLVQINNSIHDIQFTC